MRVLGLVKRHYKRVGNGDFGIKHCGHIQQHPGQGDEQHYAGREAWAYSQVYKRIRLASDGVAER